MTDQELKDLAADVLAGIKELKDRQLKTDEQFRKTDEEFRAIAEQSRKTDEEFRKVFKELGGMGRRWGEFAEGMVFPAILPLFNAWGIPIEETIDHMAAHRNGREMEVDMIAINGATLVAIEVKTSLLTEHVREHIERLQEFKFLFPRYAAYSVIGAVAGINVRKEVVQFAYRQGLFVIAQSGRSVQFLNDPQFSPKAW